LAGWKKKLDCKKRKIKTKINFNIGVAEEKRLSGTVKF